MKVQRARSWEVHRRKNIWKKLGGKDHDGMMRVIPCDHVPKQNLISLWVRSLEQEYLSMHSIKIQKIYSCLLFVGTEEKELLNYTMNWVGLFVCLLSPKEDIKVLHSPRLHTLQEWFLKTKGKILYALKAHKDWLVFKVSFLSSLRPFHFISFLSTHQDCFESPFPLVSVVLCESST